METERHSNAAESSATESRCNVVNLKEILFQRARNQKKLCKSMGVVPGRKIRGEYKTSGTGALD